MTENMLVKLFEHNNWANSQIIQACSALSDEQLDAEPQSATKGSISGEALLALARDEPSQELKTQLRTTDGYFVEPWVVMVQVINHATEHREQISSMLTALGMTPPDLDGWAYGEVTHALIPIST